MTEENKPTQVVRVDATLTEHGDFIKLHLRETQAEPVGGFHTSWESQRAYNSLRAGWRGLVEANLGRMHYETMGDLEYPTIPVFESFGRAAAIDQTPSEKTHTKYSYEYEPVKAEEIVDKLVNNMKLEEFAMRSAKLAIAASFKEGLDEGDEIESDGAEHSVNTAVEQIFHDLHGILLGYVKMRARDVKMSRKRRKAIQEVEKIPHLCFSFKNGLEIHMEGEISRLFSLLLPVIQKVRARLDSIADLRSRNLTNGEFDYEVRGELVPFEHQKVMYKIHMLLDHSANLSQMGTGKSLAVVMTIDRRIQLGQVRPGHALVIAPAGMMDTWLYKHLKKGAPHLTGKIITGSYTERLEMILNRTADVYFTNFETFSMRAKMEIGGQMVEVPLAPLFNMVQWDMIVIDEAHKIKNPEAIRTQAIVSTFRSVPYSIIMSGTINANKLYDLHSPFVFLNGAKQFNSLHQERGSGELFSLTKLHDQFRDRYFEKRGWKYLPYSFTINELRERMEEVSVRYEKKDCFELPEKLYEQVMIDMSPKQAQLYEALKNFLTAQLSDMADSGTTVTVFNVLSMMVKLAEAANGWIYDDDHQLINLPDNPKRDALMEYVDDLGDDDKAVIWSRFTNDLHTLYDALVDKYGREAVAIIHGGESCSVCGSRKTDRFAIMNRFNDIADPLRFVVVNSSVGAHGIDLTGATYEMFFSNSFVKTDRTQAEDRCHRFGMRANLTIIDFVMKGTVDEDVLLALKSWKSMTAALLGHLGIKAEKLFPAEGDKQEAPVIVEHVMQRPGECALATIAMLASKPVDLVRSWITVELNDPKKYKGTHEQVMKVVNHFLPQMAEAWDAYMKDYEAEMVSQELIPVPKEGTGAMIIRHQRSKRISHAVAFSNGFVYDPGRMGKVATEVYEAWLVQANYFVEHVFPLPAGMSMSLDEPKEAA